MIDNGEFSRRRARLLSSLPQESICLIPAAQLKTRSRDTEYPFRQDSDFWYLTGFPEADALLMLSNSQRYEGNLSVLFCLPKNQQAEIWQGRRIGPQAAVQRYGFDEAYSLEESHLALREFIDGHQQLYFALGHDHDSEQLIFEVLADLRNAPKQTRQAPSTISDVRPILHEMRLFKTAAELDVMRQAASISADAHTRAMRAVRPGMYEYQLEAELHHEFVSRGARSPAYGTIVGGGENACILHYTENSSRLNDGDLVLIDAGAELHGYAADITRTFPVSGRFSPPQRQLYDLVLAAQQAALAVIQPGNTLAQAAEAAIEVICQGLLELGILHGTLSDNIGEKHYRQYFMHGLGHWLGLDVHDVGDYKVNGQERPFQAGMVLTVEPGIYIAPDADVAAQWRGIGIRIEDNLVITDDGYQNLTQEVVKDPDEIEHLMAAVS